MKPSSAKEKGRWAEREWAKKWQEIDPEAQRQERSGAGYRKGDIDTKEPIVFEVKFHATGFTKAEQALQQAEKASPYETAVCVAYTTYREGYEPIVFLRGDDFRSLYKKAKQSELAENLRTKTFLLRRLAHDCKEVLKEFNL